MVGISNLNIGALTSANTKASEQGEAKATLGVDMSGVRDTGKSQDAKKAEGGGSGEPAHIQQMREMIKELQKQLAEAQKRLAQIAAQKTDEATKLAAITAQQANIATLSGQIQAATAELLEALTKTGGSSAGGMVSTQA